MIENHWVVIQKVVQKLICKPTVVFFSLQNET